MTPTRWMLLLTFCACALVYVWSLGNGFVNFDDTTLLLENPVLRKIDVYAMFWRAVERDYLPLTFLSYAFEIHFFGFDPFYFHLDNLILHTLNSMLLVVLLKKMFDLPNFVIGLTAVLFAVHPLHVESVAWVSERKDVLSTFFFLLTLWFYTDYVKEKSARWYLLSLLCLLLSLLSKAMAVSLPFILILYDLSQGRRKINILIEKIPFLALVAFFAWVHIRIRLTGAAASDEFLTLWDHAQNIITSLVFYLHKTLIPIGLAPYYQRGAIEITWDQWLVGGLAFAGLILIGWYHRKKSEVWFGLSFFILTLAPVLRAIPFGADFLFADRFMYIPSIGLFLAVSSVLPLRGTPGKFTRVSSGLIVIVFGWLALQQTHIWKSGETLWSDTVSKYPKTRVAYINLGILDYQAGRYDQAIARFRKAIELDPKNTTALTNLGNALYDSGHVDEAKDVFKNVAQVDPTDGDSHHSLGVIYREEKKFDLAIEEFQRCISFRRYHRFAHGNLAGLLHELRRDGEALEHAQTDVLINPHQSISHLRLGLISLQLRMWDAAETELISAIDLDPQSVDAYQGLLIIELQKQNQTGIASIKSRAQLARIAVYEDQARDELASIEKK